MSSIWDMNQSPTDLLWIPDSLACFVELPETEGSSRTHDTAASEGAVAHGDVSARNIDHPSEPGRIGATPYVLNVSLTFGSRGDAEQAETQLATTGFNGLMNSWSEVEELRW
jgi:hypothetical protein